MAVFSPPPPLQTLQGASLASTVGNEIASKASALGGTAQTGRISCLFARFPDVGFGRLWVLAPLVRLFWLPRSPSNPPKRTNNKKHPQRAACPSGGEIAKVGPLAAGLAKAAWEEMKKFISCFAESFTLRPALQDFL
ncbi:unnamed protein product [Symbiodinium natans]|uniref:Uncharacterized protein n=1 Tax=Symbiodinium natans TaxID=878477 RepID=A0A812QYV1_9DINO|nr:unnamed protein product [Symbiodinium natans]